MVAVSLIWDTNIAVHVLKHMTSHPPLKALFKCSIKSRAAITFLVIWKNQEPINGGLLEKYSI